ncbi:MAG: aconitase X [Candidatus Bathyarchaeia archaeon]
MHLTNVEEKMLAGEEGYAVQKSMQILTALGEIFGADKMIPVSSVQVAGVSYYNLGDAGLEYLETLAGKGAKARVKTTLNPAGMDLENWRELGIDEEFARKQEQVIQAFVKMGIIPSCTCTPYLVGNEPGRGDHIAWSESSAVTYANSILGAMTNREGGPSALAAAIAGRTPSYGMHIEENRKPQVRVKVDAKLVAVPDFGALGYVVGKKIGPKIPLFEGIEGTHVEQLKSLCASMATYGGTALFHTHDATYHEKETPAETLTITRADIEGALRALNDETAEVDFVALGCPHCTLDEIKRIADLLEGRKVTREFWICTARQTMKEAEKIGYAQKIRTAGAKFACDTCMAVAPLKGRFSVLATDSAKACYYGRGTNDFKTRIGSVEECVNAAVTGKWS